MEIFKGVELASGTGGKKSDRAPRQPICFSRDTYLADLPLEPVAIDYTIAGCDLVGVQNVWFQICSALLKIADQQNEQKGYFPAGIPYARHDTR
jgi:hypothetical protein